jgi:hypothetical protein
LKTPHFQNLEGVHQILLKNGKILPHPPTLRLNNTCK